MQWNRTGRLVPKVILFLAVLVSLGGIHSSAYGTSASGSCSNGVVIPSPGSNAGLVGDCEILMAVRDTLSGNVALDWSYDRAMSSWQGVTVDTRLNRVTKLRLPTMGLTGNIPPELGDLSSLTVINLGGNQLTGSIPPELGGLSNLIRLNLFGNDLSGNIPTELGDLTNLEFLWLGRNSLTGCLPAGLHDVPEGDAAAIGLPNCLAADGPSVPESAATVEVRIVARKLSDGRVEFGLQERTEDGSWGDRVLPTRRFFPTDAPVGRWLRSSVLTLNG